jgi:hypothetical protein
VPNVKRQDAWKKQWATKDQTALILLRFSLLKSQIAPMIHRITLTGDNLNQPLVQPQKESVV